MSVNMNGVLETYATYGKTAGKAGKSSEYGKTVGKPELSEDGKKKLVQQKVEEYNKLLKEVQNGSGNDEGINA